MSAPQMQEHWLVRGWRAFESWFFAERDAPVVRAGARGEDVAAEYLRAKGYSVLERNWTCGRGELDIVCRHGERLVVVEVKSSRADEAYHAADRVGEAKAEQLWRLTEQYMKQRRYVGQSVQVDVVEVTFEADGRPVIRHLEAAVEERRRGRG